MEAGIQVFLTREMDQFIELKERTKIANELAADAIISIHCNAGGGAGGFESFRYTSASLKSKELQETLHESIITELRKYNVIDRKPKTGNLHMLRESNMSAVLTENLFIDADAILLQNDQVIEAIIDGHVAGVVQFFGLEQKDVMIAADEEDLNMVSPWARTAWEQAALKGYMDGTRPRDSVTREELAAILIRIENNK
ncbi:N-acetylmuramoyl-L-alanine amidase [Paenibacillus urinalis]|uniref:N-acetylmuramoyl-L-alanine amidase n=1 Tax=Paenibacillus urinalis TaxID=521520 RepID=A0AAX3MUN4_9BACL|nr:MULTISPECIES: N-acetylmuramoyl-L-alanine amidase [Paenibacillus]WDH81118.1 N-acetylmuramoyl-L-alanine amidase [Paenibacillus urinalis]WDH97171.1 N-acetylmuramoyl-L-alanine amidase [Paenibacillus urinalis]WDI00833.1 N-acetylmuramoyl-L-alanine amidase [Paenibacillus urinalis]GAK39518.1 hypothetical protein TCA2_2006 [Paenibacillus sp. TCA20]